MSYVKTLAVSLALAALLAGPQQTFAAETTWPLQSPATVLLAYGEAYSGRTHSGIDLRAGAGDRVVTPCSASVSFAGRVPAGVGQTCLAVTLALADGRSMTLMPLATAAVTAGSSVGAGAAIGEIAAAGDGSCAESHLHVGLRRGDTYLDPMTLLVTPSAGASEPQPQAASIAEAPVVNGGASSAPAAVAPEPVAGAGSVPAANGSAADSGCQVGTPAAAATAPSAPLATAPTHALAHALAHAPAHAPARGQVRSPASAQAPSALPAADVAPRSVSPGAATRAEPAPVAQLPAGVSLASSTSQAQTRARATAPTHGASTADAVLKRTRSAVWDSATSMLTNALGIARTVAIELALVAFGITGAAIRKRPSITPAPASVRPVEDAIAAAAGRCYTRRAHFLLRAQPSQSRSRIVQRR